MTGRASQADPDAWAAHGSSTTVAVLTDSGGLPFRRLTGTEFSMPIELALFPRCDICALFAFSVCCLPFFCLIDDYYFEDTCIITKCI